jgi:hypothetical protein
MWPQLTNIEPNIVETIKSRKDTKVASKLNPWVRIISGAVVGGVKGLVVQSINDFKLFAATGENKASIYGNKDTSGALGYDLANKNAIGSMGEQRGFRPSPIITSLTCKEGKDQISRELEIGIKCFTKDQMETLQSFLQEPGYNLCVEWGWNTPDALSESINTQENIDTILNKIADRCLNQDNIHKVRKSSNGQYDIFLGFVVGGNISSDGEAFNMTVKCKGAPGLPTFLQTHKKTQELDSKGKVVDKPTINPFPASETLQNEDTAAVVGKRRFKKMFNDLPTEKQIKEIKDLVDTVNVEYNQFDFINFDEVINEALSSVESDGSWDFLNWFGKKDIKVGTATLKKEALFPEQFRWISMNLAAKILNKNGILNAYKIRDKEVKCMIDISESVIGGFPYMFSIKPDKLLIPGTLPPFYTYFLSTVDVKQEANGVINGVAPVDYHLGWNNIRFPMEEALDSYGYKEEAKYWGYLKDLYINFDAFKSKLNQSNKNIREVFLDILNELSSGANSFWNFQIVEKKKDNGDIILTVIDENWVGKNNQKEPPVKFVHSGIDSAFLSADLDISIPADMTNAVVARRLSLATNPESPVTNPGELFRADLDMFMGKVTLEGAGTGDKKEPDPPVETESEKQAKVVENAEKQISDIDVKLNENQKLQNDLITKFNALRYGQDAEKAQLEADIAKLRAEKGKLYDEKNVAITTRKDAWVKYDAAVKKEKEDKEAAEQAKLTANFDKIVIVANPAYGRMSLTISSVKDKSAFQNYLRIYTLQDGNYFDRLKNDAFSPQGTGKNSRLSQPLPIKYTFTTMGITGIRRGDMFNVLGIPEKYADHGMFQVTQVEQELNGMEWKTTVTGEYRQFNS